MKACTISMWKPAKAKKCTSQVERMASRSHDRSAQVIELLNKYPELPALSSMWLSILACASLVGASLATHQTSTAKSPHDSSYWSSNEDSWNYWWSYSGVSGPSYWGLLNSDWFLCDKGRRQSPINIETSALVYDPHLTPLVVTDNNLIAGILFNDGHSIVFNGSSAAAVIALKSDGASEGSDSLATNNETEKSRTKIAQNGNSLSKRSVQDPAQSGPVVSVNNFILDEPGTLEGSQVEMLVRMDELKSELAINNERASQFNELESGNSSQSLNEIGQTSFADDLTGADSIRPPDFTGAGLAYSYRFESLQLKFGAQAEVGSEHQINKRPFGAELQLFAYNWHLYRNFQEASMRPYGLLAISILIDTLPQAPAPQSITANMRANEQLERLLAQTASSLAHRGQFVPLRALNLSSLLPQTDQFVTYEGSLTQPACHESVTWLLLNRPIYALKQSLDKLRSITADEQFAPSSSGTPLAGNARPLQPVNDRPIRTNIRPTERDAPGRNQLGQATCPQLWTRYSYVQPTSA